MYVVMTGKHGFLGVLSISPSSGSGCICTFLFCIFLDMLDLIHTYTRHHRRYRPNISTSSFCRDARSSPSHLEVVCTVPVPIVTNHVYDNACPKPWLRLVHGRPHMAPTYTFSPHKPSPPPRQPRNQQLPRLNHDLPALADQHPSHSRPQLAPAALAMPSQPGDDAERLYAGSTPLGNPLLA